MVVRQICNRRYLVVRFGSMAQVFEVNTDVHFYMNMEICARLAQGLLVTEAACQSLPPPYVPGPGHPTTWIGKGRKDGVEVWRGE